MQNNVTMPSLISIESYKREIFIYRQREKGHPSAPFTLRQAFKKDMEIVERVSAELRAADGRTNGESESKAKKRVTDRLCDEYENRPGGLEIFKCAVENDLERFAEESKHFCEVTQRKFDEEIGLLQRADM